MSEETMQYRKIASDCSNYKKEVASLKEKYEAEQREKKTLEDKLKGIRVNRILRSEEGSRATEVISDLSASTTLQSLQIIEDYSPSTSATLNLYPSCEYLFAQSSHPN